MSFLPYVPGENHRFVPGGGARAASELQGGDVETVLFLVIFLLWVSRGVPYRNKSSYHKTVGVFFLFPWALGVWGCEELTLFFLLFASKIQLRNLAFEPIDSFVVLGALPKFASCSSGFLNGRPTQEIAEGREVIVHMDRGKGKLHEPKLKNALCVRAS